MPTISFGDAAFGLPFPDNSFDIVFSQVAWLYFGNKIGVLRDINRVLRPNGIAKIDADEVRPDLPSEYQRLVEIWQDGRLVPFGDYVRPFGMAFVPATVGEFLRFGKSVRCCEDLEQVLQIDLAQINFRWRGIKCVYRSGPA
jgi:SAM-dependent methyltransferase